MALPQLYVPVRGLRWATPPPLGRVLLLLVYWAVVAYMMAWRATIDDAYYYERIGYRNAWVALAQLPMLYLLAAKANPVGWLVGASHERLNWLHRWVARTMLVTATVHGAYFLTEWVRADFVAYELALMPSVKYGMGAWAVLAWSVVVGVLPVRRLAYEVWLLQHVAAAAAMLWLLYKHIPSNALYLLWMSVAIFALDRTARWMLLFWRNVRLGAALGHAVTLRAVSDAVTVVSVADVGFAWRPGQHVYLWLPRLGPLEAHPYTLARAHRAGDGCMELVVCAHGGFSRRLADAARRRPKRTLRGFVTGPYGSPPRWDAFETLVLLGASTGTSFTLPILESVAGAARTCVKRIEMALIARTADEIGVYVERAQEAARGARARGIDVRLHVAVTGGGAEGEAGVPLVQQRRDSCDAEKASAGVEVGDGGGGPGAALVRWYRARPDIAALVRDGVERARGETGVAVCGGRELVARTRNCVSRLSDERAVHKGTGAQGIFLHSEEYSF